MSAGPVAKTKTKSILLGHKQNIALGDLRKRYVGIPDTVLGS